VVIKLGRINQEEMEDSVEIGDDNLYDDTPESFEMPTIKLGLSPREQKDAEDIRPYTRGVGLVIGPPRSGKDLFSNVFTYKGKNYFEGIEIMRDERPRRPYGRYTLFNEEVLMGEISKMAAVARGDIPRQAKTEKDKKALSSLVDKWHTDRGKVKMKNSMMYFTEFWRYLLNRHPMNPMGIEVGGIIKTWGHIDTLVLGVAQMKHDLDRFTCLPYITYEVRCSWMLSVPYTAECKLYRTRYVSSMGTIETVSKRPTVIHVSGVKPRPEVGIRNANIEHAQSGLEKDIICAVHDLGIDANLHTIGKMLDFDNSKLDELYDTIIYLHINGVVRCLTYFDLFNSKSAVDLKPMARINM